MNMYQEDKRATEQRQCEMAAQLQEFSLSMTNMRILKIRLGKMGRVATRTGEFHDARTRSSLKRKTAAGMLQNTQN